MGEIVIAVNSINDEFAHAFIEVRTSVGIRQIHGEPSGNAFPGGLYSLIGDSTGINVETRLPPSEGGAYNSITLGQSIPDSVLNDVYRDVLAAAQGHFRNAQYEVPRLADPVAISTGHLARSISVGGISISIVPDFFRFNLWELIRTMAIGVVA